jgi:hypothetical protein
MAFDSHRVYHYRPDARPRDLDALVANRIWSATVESLNDPFEFAALRALNEYPAKLEQFKNTGVTCFSRSLTNPLLWSHYAASHTGYVVGYDSAHAFFGGDKGLGGRFLHDVRYEDVVPTLDRFSLDELPMAAVTTKPTCWAYEQEIRLIKQIGNESVDIPPEAVKEVAFGARMSAERIDQFSKALAGAGIQAKLARMEYLAEGYGVKPVWTTHR